jgi:2-polyprenyl-3-methyl-5-hydroxy-6-metoxy-1,4-benzoquinol methylase
MTTCPICHGLGVLPAWRTDRFQLSRCAGCDHLFVSSGLEARELEGAYDESYYEAGEGSASGYADYLGDAPTRLRGFAGRLRQLEAHVPQRGRLLDYGCAVGLFVKVARDAGWNAVGYERSAWAAAYGRDTWKLDIVVGRGDEEPSFARQFDAVTMWDVLEHLEDPLAVVQRVVGWLKPGGVLALNTVNSASYGARRAGAHWRHVAPPHHLQYFCRRSLRQLLRACGLRLVKMQAQGVMFTADRRSAELHGLRRAIEDTATHWRLKPLASALDLVDEVEMMAVKPA